MFNTGEAIGSNADSTVRNAYGRAQWTSIVTPRMVNEVRFGWFKDRLFDAASPDFLSPGLGLAGLTVNSTGNLGIATSYPRLNPSETRFSFAENLSWIKGAHALKFGVDIAHTEDYQNQLIESVRQLQLLHPDRIRPGLQRKHHRRQELEYDSQRFGNPIVDTNLVTYGLYAQDQWPSIPSVQLGPSLGLHKDPAAHHRESGLSSNRRDQFGQGQHRSARRSFVWPGTRRKTVIRAGYGIFYARYQTGLVNTLFVNNNVYQQSITYNSGTAAQLAAPVYSTSSLPRSSTPAGTTDIIFADQNLRNPYPPSQYGVERELSRPSNQDMLVCLEPRRSPVWRPRPERRPPRGAGDLQDPGPIGRHPGEPTQRQRIARRGRMQDTAVSH